MFFPKDCQHIVSGVYLYLHSNYSLTKSESCTYCLNTAFMKQIKLTVMAVMTLLALQSGYSQTMMGSKHDFSTKVWNTSVGGQICIVCHTPYNAVVLPDAPLWNHQTTVAGFALYTAAISSTFNATTGQPDGSSKLCLSCHDGTVALGNFGGTTNDTHVITGAFNLGTSLSNNHLISFLYDAALATSDGGLRNPATAAGVGTGTIAATMLFNGKVQCASCHDVHNLTGLAKLLVKSNTTSALCLTCHAK